MFQQTEVVLSISMGPIRTACARTHVSLTLSSIRLTFERLARIARIAAGTHRHVDPHVAAVLPNPEMMHQQLIQSTLP